MNKDLDAVSLAGRMLGRRGMSLGELYEGLLSRGVQPHEAAEACRRMQELGYANDEEYARSLAEHYTARAYGLFAVRAKLQAHSLDRAVIDRALADWEPDDRALDRLVRMKMRGESDETALRKTVAALIRRGFTHAQAKDAVGRYMGELASGGENGGSAV